LPVRGAKWLGRRIPNRKDGTGMKALRAETGLSDKCELQLSICVSAQVSFQAASIAS